MFGILGVWLGGEEGGLNCCEYAILSVTGSGSFWGAKRFPGVGWKWRFPAAPGFNRSRFEKTFFSTFGNRDVEVECWKIY